MKIVILENVRSAHNVGSVFRTADAAGVGAVFLVGYTPLPIDRFGRTQKEIEKTSLGASETLSWKHFNSVAKAIEEAKTQGCRVVVVEQVDGAVSLSDFSPSTDDVFVFGNEVDGVSIEATEKADTIIDIPMFGTKESLNVSVAVGVTLYHGIEA